MTSITLAYMFINSHILDTIKKTHAEFIAMREAAVKLLGRPLTLFDSLCLPYAKNSLPNIDAPTMKKIQDEIRSGGPIQWCNFGVYDMISYGAMSRLAALARCCLQVGGVQNTELYSIDLDTATPSEKDLQVLGLAAPNGASALVMKSTWLYFMVRNSGDLLGTPGHWYFGNAAKTRPVENFLKRYFRLVNAGPHEANNVTNTIAKETGIDPLSVNTAMFLYGKDL